MTFSIRFRAGVALLLALTAMPADADAVAPQCEHPTGWTRIGTSSARGGGPLSPLQIAADPTIIRDGRLLRMWFTNGNSRGQTGIAYAEGTDGMVWDVHHEPVAPDSVMDLVLTAPAGAWDSPGVETANVLRGPDGGYRLYYSGNHAPQGSVTYAIGLATSADGLHWTRLSKPVLEAKNVWEQPLCTSPGNPSTCTNGGVLEPSVLYDPVAQLFKLWYVGLGEAPDSFRTFRIGYATSPDGITWNRRADPVLSLGATGKWDDMWTTHVNVVADPRAGYHMFYFGSTAADYRDGVEMQRGAIGHAYSADGITWTRDPANPVLSPRPGQVDAWSAGGPTALFDGNRLKLWYFGSPSTGLKSTIVLAEAVCAGP